MAGKRSMHRLQLAAKRLLDIVLCGLILALCWPCLIAVAVAVKMSSPGPVFFVQERVGYMGRVFRLVKFRTMTGRPSRESARTWTSEDEARITPVGGLLRDYGLDELPQILNIFTGDMSIVGPRPPLPAQAKAYTPFQHHTFLMRPGVLSLAAVEGRRSIPMERRIDLHVQYVKDWSLWLDFEIMWRALIVVLRRQDATEVAAHQEAGPCES